MPPVRTSGLASRRRAMVVLGTVAMTLGACASATRPEARLTATSPVAAPVSSTAAAPTLDDAKLLVKMLKGIHAKINLIPFNPWPGTKYECSDWETIEAFAEVLNRAGYASPIRTPRGRDILAACGQLKSASERKRGERVRNIEAKAGV